VYRVNIYDSHKHSGRPGQVRSHERVPVSNPHELGSSRHLARAVAPETGRVYHGVQCHRPCDVSCGGLVHVTVRDTFREQASIFCVLCMFYVSRIFVLCTRRPQRDVLHSRLRKLETSQGSHHHAYFNVCWVHGYCFVKK
jgi:hypothetical protein